MEASVYVPLEIIADGLKELLPEMTFVGGASVVMHLDSSGAPAVRPTEDVDYVIEISSRIKFLELESRLRELGFEHDTTPDSPTCRWVFKGVVVDVMPTDPLLLGFSNSWYKLGVEKREERNLPSGQKVYTFSLPYFIASKLEAFDSRGEEDIRLSPDLEDILIVLDGNKDPLRLVKAAGVTVKDYLSASFSRLRSNAHYNDLIEGTLGREGSKRVRRMRNLVQELTLLE